MRLTQADLLSGRKNLQSAVHKPVAIINFGSHFLFQLLELILGQGPREDLGSPLDQVVNHVPDTAEHLPVVLLLWGGKMEEKSSWKVWEDTG